jgi:hypothetical protein
LREDDSEGERQDRITKPAPQMVLNKSVKQSSPDWQQFAISRHASPRGGFLFFAPRSPLLEIALVRVSLDHVASRVVNADHSIV